VPPDASSPQPVVVTPLISLRLRVSPAPAELLDAEGRLVSTVEGETTVELPRSDAPVTFTLHAPGHQDGRLKLVPDRDQVVAHTLAPLPDPAADETSTPPDRRRPVRKRPQPATKPDARPPDASPGAQQPAPPQAVPTPPPKGRKNPELFEPFPG
jgi:hypothetical protein